MDTSTGASAQPFALFVSDLHLEAGRPHTTACFLAFLQQQARHAQQLYLLGDMFEYWAGDDDLDQPLHQQILSALRDLHARGVALFWIAGNRDFLLGTGFAQACGMQLLEEVHILQQRQNKILLTHGDAQCTDDHAYMAFRAQVRQAGWQQQFLGKALAERRAIIANLRSASRDSQKMKSSAIMDVNQASVEAVLNQAQCQTMIHGHTHRPARHDWQADGRHYQRHVLPDWECDVAQGGVMRGGWISLDHLGNITHHGLSQLQLPPAPTVALASSSSSNSSFTSSV